MSLVRLAMSVPSGPYRHPAPPVDGVREIYCEKRMGSVIGAGRCLADQANGCSCPRMATEQTAAELRLAVKSRAFSHVRRPSITQMLADGVPHREIARRHKTSIARVTELAVSTKENE